MSLPTTLAARYRSIRLLGSGGFGQVLLARDESLGREVAIKVLDAGFEDPEHLPRFEHEARITSALRHPNIVTLFDFGVADRHAFIVYDYVPGQDLEEILQREQPIPLAQVFHWATRVALALEEAHRKGVIHRDLKPANVLIRESDGEPLLCDFGVARSPRSRVRTKEGLILGTPAYVAPEVWHGEEPGPLSDQWAWAATVFEMVYGERLQAQSRPREIWDSLQAGWQASIPGPQKGRFPHLEPVLLRSLANRPEDRFPDMGAFASALRHPLVRRPSNLSRTWPSRGRHSPEIPGSSRRTQPPRASSFPKRTLLALLLSVLVAAGFLLPEEPAPPPLPALPPPAAPRPAREQELRKALLEVLPRRVQASEIPVWERRQDLQNRLPEFLDPRLELSLRRQLERSRGWFADLDDEGLWGAPEVQSTLSEQVVPAILDHLLDLSAFTSLGLVVVGDQLTLPNNLERGEFIQRVKIQQGVWQGFAHELLADLEARSSRSLPLEILHRSLQVLLAPSWSGDLEGALGGILEGYRRPEAKALRPQIEKVVFRRIEDLAQTEQACRLREAVLTSMGEVPASPPSDSWQLLERRLRLARLRILVGAACSLGESSSHFREIEVMHEELDRLLTRRSELAEYLARHLLEAYFALERAPSRNPRFEALQEETRKRFQQARGT